jgi:membrane-associated protein
LVYFGDYAKMKYMIPGMSLDAVLSILGYAVCLIIFAETGLMVGFFLPGDSLLFTAGALTGLGILHVDIVLLAILFFVAAVLGNSVGYLFGYKVGRKLFRKKNSRIFKQEYLQAAEKFYEKHGPAAVVLAQFMPIIRTFNPVVTGISQMHYLKFIAYNVFGAFIWTFGFTLIGYYLFRTFGYLINPEQVSLYILPIIILIIVLSLLPAVIHILRDEQRRRSIFAKIKGIFRRK